MVEYVPFVYFDGQRYLDLQPVTIRGSQLDRVLFRVRCSFFNLDPRRSTPRLINGTAFLPAGTAVYQIRGYSPRCRLGAYMNGHLTAYLTQRDLHGKSAPQLCALRRLPGS
jgi:hypothetical protein